MRHDDHPCPPGSTTRSLHVPKDDPVDGFALDVLIVPLDGSAEAEAAVAVAGRIAASTGADLELLSVVGDPRAVPARREALERVCFGGVRTRRDVVVARDPIAAIGDAADGPRRQVCLATRGRGRTAPVLGSVALRVLRRVRHPVLCVGPRIGVVTTTPSSVGVLVCLDGSSRSEAGLKPAALWAGVLDASMTLATAIENAPPPVARGKARRQLDATDALDYLAGHASRIDSGASPIDVRVLEDPLGPLEALRLQLQGEGAAMVVAATRRRSGVARVVLGSAATAIVQHSPAPVLLVPTDH
jgi:nucleotide-binding universal stress UspA family protein